MRTAEQCHTPWKPKNNVSRQGRWETRACLCNGALRNSAADAAPGPTRCSNRWGKAWNMDGRAAVSRTGIIRTHACLYDTALRKLSCRRSAGPNTLQQQGNYSMQLGEEG